MKIYNLLDKCVLKWRLTTLCNYKCSYCVQTKKENNADLKTDFDQCMSVIDDVIRIANELHRKHNKNIRIDLIGGEVSLFDDLKILLDKLYQVECVGEIYITTNLSRNIDYYIELCNIVKKYNKTLTLCASYHDEYVDLDKFIDKAKILHELIHNDLILETVALKNKNIDEFIKLCDEIGCQYMCDGNMKDVSKSGNVYKNNMNRYRYKVITVSGEESFYTTRNELIMNISNSYNKICTLAKYCTKDFDFVYINKTVVETCRGPVPILLYNLYNYAQICLKPMCSICGEFSVY